MRLTSTGNLGISTGTPQARFHVLSTGSSINAAIQYTGDLIIQDNPGVRNSSTGASLEFVIPANTDGSNPWGQARIITVGANGTNQDATGKMILGTRRMFDKWIVNGTTWNYGDDLVIDGAGNVGIGTINPNGYKLAVKGLMHTQSIQVDMNGWSDYVFDKEYDLATLKDLKSYIDKNNHLPEIPSADEVARDGINLGEMNAKLLRKIEELTLYLIEEHQNNQELKSTVANLKNEVTLVKRKLRNK